VTYDFDLAAELVFCDLTATFFIEVGSVDLRLELFDFNGLRADFLNFFLAALVIDTHLGKLTSKLLFHFDHVERA
jgi:hypothetical protein